MFKNKKQSLLTAQGILLSFMATLLMPAVSALGAFGELSVSSIDSIAGHESTLTINGASAQSTIDVTMVTPQGATLQTQARSNYTGVATIPLDGEVLMTSGQYLVQAKENQTGLISNTHQFFVYPASFNNGASEIVAETTNSNSAKARVYIKDAYGNPVPNHMVALSSSNLQDVIELATPTKFSDDKGMVAFTIKGQSPGERILTATNLTTDTVLTNTSSVLFGGSTYTTQTNNTWRPVYSNLPTHVTPQWFGGDERTTGQSNLYTSTLLAQAANNKVSKLVISELSSNPPLNQSLNVTITAVDQNNNVVTDYAGTVRFATDDANASIPPDYTFKPANLGKHQFSLGLRFATPGTHTFRVIDVNNLDIRGEMTVTVGGATPTATPAPSATNPPITSTPAPTPAPTTNNQRIKPTFTSPQGGKYKTNTITVSGQAGVGDQLVLYDNGIVKKNFSADNTGKFTTVLTNLSKGAHKIKVGVTDGTGAILIMSDEISLDIDTDAPMVDEVKIFPNNVITVGGNALVKAYSEKNLTEAAIIVNKKIYELSPAIGEPGAYSVSFKVPDQVADYPIDVIVVDELRNEATYKDAAVLKVVNSNLSVSGDNPSTGDATLASSTPIPVAVTPGSPSTPTDLQSHGSDNRVTLTWTASTDDTFVQKYRVHYGIEKENLIVSVNTFDNTAQWYIPNLTNGQKYYFAVQAIDSDGNESPLTEVIEGSPIEGGVHYVTPENSGASASTVMPVPTPTPTVTTNVTTSSSGTANSLNTVIAPPTPAEVPDTGPEGIVITAIGILVAASMTLISRKKSVVAVTDSDYFKLDV